MKSMSFTRQVIEARAALETLRRETGVEHFALVGSSMGGAVATILAGRELGLAPMASLRTVHLVKGRVVIGADAQLALVHQAGWSSQWVKTDADQAVLELSNMAVMAAWA